MLIPSGTTQFYNPQTSLSRRVNANSQRADGPVDEIVKLIKKGEC